VITTRFAFAEPLVSGMIAPPACVPSPHPVIVIYPAQIAQTRGRATDRPSAFWRFLRV
jgi:hypothetical protein